MVCGYCGHAFKESEGDTGCGACGGCHGIHCPRCRYRNPVEPEFLKRLKALMPKGGGR